MAKPLSPKQKQSTLSGQRKLTKYLSLLVLSAGGLVLFGWMFDIPALTRLIPGLVTMKVNTAICFILIGLAIYLVQENSAPIVFKSLAVLALVIALLSAVETIFHANLGIDEFIIRDLSNDPNTTAAGRMVVLSATCFGLLSAAILLFGTKYVKQGQRLTGLALIISLSIFVSYPFSAAQITGLTSFTGMALHTSILFVLASAVLLIEMPYNSWSELFFSESPWSRVGRKMFLLAISVPLLLGWLIFFSQSHGYISEGLGVSVYVAVTILILVFILESVGRFAARDPLTNVFNRSYFQQTLIQEIAASRRYKKTGALLYLDLDHFKQINDKWGHAAGDRVLTDVAQKATNVLRKSDSMARLGGDEFAIILRQTNRPGARIVAKKILEALSSIDFFSTRKANLSASIGIAIFPTDSEEPDDLVHLADREMYKLKRAKK